VPTRNNHASWALAVLAATALAGCGTDRSASQGIGYYLNPQADLKRISRVVFVELDYDGASRYVTPQVTQSLFQAIQSKRQFRLEILRRSDPRCADLPLDPQGSYTLEQMAEIRRALGCEAILFGSARSFQPFPKMRVELYLRLLDLRSGALVWGVDHTWDSADKDTEGRIRRYYKDKLREGYEPVGWRIVVVSPQQFGKFVACEVSDTLVPPKANGTDATTPSMRVIRGTLEKLSEIPGKLAKVD